MELSIIIPTLNEETTIAQTLQSLIKQDFKHGFEIIIVDGGSTDNTLQIARNYDVNVIIAHGENIARSQNIGAASAATDVLIFTQADTTMPRNWLRKIYGEFARDDDLVAITGPLNLTPDAPTWMKIEYAGWNIVRWLTSLLPLPLGAFFSSGPNIAVRRWAFKAIGGYDEFLPMHEDGTLGKTLKKFGKVRFCGPIYLPLYVTVSPRRSKLGFKRMNRYYLYILGDLFPFNIIFPERVWRTIRIQTWLDSLRSRNVDEREIARRIVNLQTSRRNEEYLVA
jgi:glycosyltransferase involved in cell wall biosynthesis